MSTIDQAIEDLASLLGFDAIGADHNGHFAAEIEGQGQLHAEALEDELVIYLSRAIAVGVDRVAAYKSALRSVHFEQHLPLRSQVAVLKDDLVFIVRLDEDEIDAQSIEAAVELLFDLHSEFESKLAA